MQRPIRRKEFALDRDQAWKLLESGEYGILATIGPQGYPYGLPISYVLFKDAIYFHCGLQGHKLENLRYNEKVSFTVVGKTELVPAEPAVNYESVIALGLASEVGGGEKVKALQELVRKYAPDFEKEHQEIIASQQDLTVVIKIEIRTITGKSRGI
ncbi:MAG: pyridoxamine 5'-phosphate oxidase family protein [Firmicutes bacterium]|nr:pyridoxamine 5'-phosphate oxidase family protein [Bacillota bacterium]